MLQTIWGWQPALYLFLGGMGAGAFAISAIVYLRKWEGCAKAVCITMWAAIASLAIGLLLLLSELVFPLRGLCMWQSFSHLSSWMSLGAWGAFAALAVFAVSAVLAIPKVTAATQAKGESAEKKVACLRKVLAVVGIALGLFVAFYTGMLLSSAPGVPLWDTMLLPFLFLVSGLDTGVALFELVYLFSAKKPEKASGDEKAAAPHSGAVSFLQLSVVVLVLIEAIVLALFVALPITATAGDGVAQTAQASAALLASGPLAPYFWVMVVLVGLALPLICAIAGHFLVKGGKAKAESAVTFVGAAGALVGGCELRFLALAAGLHAPIVADALAKFIS